MSNEPIMPFEVARGGTPESMRKEGDKHRSVASYVAQFGIPREDVEEQLLRSSGHNDMVRWCRGWAKTPAFRNRSMALDVYPTETRQQRRARLRSEEKTLAKKEKQLESEQRAVKQGRPMPKSAVSGFVPAGQVVGNYDMPAQRKFFGCEDWSDEDLDTWVEHLKTLPGGSWLDGPVRQGDRRVYAMSCIKLQRDDPVKYERLIVKGEMWINYGVEEDTDV